MIPGARIYWNNCQWLHDDSNRQSGQNRNAFHAPLPRAMRAIALIGLRSLSMHAVVQKGPIPQVQKGPAGMERASTKIAGTGKNERGCQLRHTHDTLDWRYHPPSGVGICYLCISAGGEDQTGQRQKTLVG